MSANKILILIVALILGLFLYACSATASNPLPPTLVVSPPAPTLSPTPAYTSTPTSSQTPTPTRTPSPTPALPEFDFQVTIADYREMEVSISISNLPAKPLSLYRLAAPVLEALPPLTITEVTDMQGNSLDYSLSDWRGEADRHLEIMAITSPAAAIRIRYEVDLRGERYWEITPQYIAVSENQVFFQPDADKINVGYFAFNFILPDNWNVVTRLTPFQDGYRSNTKDTVRVVTLNRNWQRFFFGSPLLLGEFDTVEEDVGSIRVIGAYPQDDSQYATDASFVAPIFAHQMEIMGDPSLGYGDYAILYVFGPRIPNGRDGGLIPTIGTHHGLFEYVHVDDDRHLAHEMYHMWFGDGNSLPDAWRFMRVPAWFMEGINEYLGVLAHYDTGAFDEATKNRWQRMFYSEYRRYAGTSNDVPVTECQESLSLRTEAWRVCLYSKSHTLFLTLDQVMRHGTEGRIGIEDVLYDLLSRYSRDPITRITTSQILSASRDVSGLDLRAFFTAYVSGNDRLPVEIVNGEVQVMWDDLVPID